MTFEPNLTQRIMRKAKSRVTHDWRNRLRDYSSVLAQIGLAVQGLLLTLPAGTVSATTQAWIASAFYALIQIAKIITEPGRKE